LRAPIGNGLDLKLGVFDSIIGYESHDSVNNPNWTRSYGTTVEPHTHTGLLATYQAADWLGLAGGIANTTGPTINARANPPKAESYKTYLFSVALTAPETFGFMKNSTIYAGLVNGFGSPSTFNLATGSTIGAVQQNYYVGATVATPMTALKVGFSYDYLGIGNQGGITVNNYANTFAWYASFQATEKLSFHARGEYLWQRASLPGIPSKLFAATATVQYDLWKNVLSRLEVRWDHAADGTVAYGGTLPGGAPSKKNSVLVAANLVYKF
jgi:hypothetical protein